MEESINMNLVYQVNINSIIKKAQELNLLQEIITEACIHAYKQGKYAPDYVMFDNADLEKVYQCLTAASEECGL